MKEHHCTSIVPLFNHLSEEEQDKIESLVIHCHFNKGETVWQPGDEPLLIIVASGSMKVYMIAGNGREQLLRLLSPGSYEGANALLGARAQDLFIDTLEATDACLLRKSDFTALLEKTPKLALKLLEINAQRMADTMVKEAEQKKAELLQQAEGEARQRKQALEQEFQAEEYHLAQA